MFHSLIIIKNLSAYFCLQSFLEIKDIYNSDASLENYPERSKVQNEIKEEVWNIVSSPDTVFTKNGEKYTSFDLHEVRWEFKTDNSVQEYFLRWFNIGLTRKDGFERVNAMYQSIINTYESRYLRNIPDSLKMLKFSSVKDIRTFLNATGEWRLWIYRCELVKLFLSYARTNTETSYAQIKHIHKQINWQVFKPFSITSEESIPGSPIMDSKFSWEFHGTNFSGYARYKSLSSIIWKEVANSDYNSLSDFKDLHGYTFECKDTHDILLIFQQFYLSGILKDMEIDNKNLITEEDVLNHQGLDKEFKELLLWEIKKNKHKTQEKQIKKGNSQNYQEIKIRWTSRYTDPQNPDSQHKYTWVEVKFQLNDNKNEYGTSFHGVLEIKKRLRELTRLSTMLRLKDIVNFVNNFFEVLEEELALKWKTLGEYIPELIKDFQEEWILWPDIKYGNEDEEIPQELYMWLFKYLEKDLVRVKKNKKSQKWYYVHNTYLNKAKAWIIPEVEKV